MFEDRSGRGEEEEEEEEEEEVIITLYISIKKVATVYITTQKYLSV